MEMTGSYRIAAPRQTVWEALNDPDVLRACIPGCQTLEKTSDTSFEAKVKAKVGPVSATFNGAVTLSDLNPPESYNISGEGKGGVAGFAKGGANVHLADEGDATLLTYDVKAQVGGKLAQIGARLIDGTAKKMAEQFFSNFAEKVGAPVEGEAATGAEAQAVASSVAPPPAAAPAVESRANENHGPEDHGREDHGPEDHGSKDNGPKDRGQADHGHDDHGHAGPPPGLKDADLNRDVGRGARTGVWVAGLILLVLILLAIFGLGGGENGGEAASH